MSRRIIHSDQAPQAIGPYSQAVHAAGWIWVSGQIPLNPKTGELEQGGIEAQAEQALRNIQAILNEAGAGLEQVVRVTLWLTDMGDFEKVNRVYADFFGNAPPARVCVEVAGLPKGANIEIDAVAIS